MRESLALVQFHNYSTWLGKPGIYLEGERELILQPAANHINAYPTDLFVSESRRGAGVGKALFGYLGKLAKERDCGRLDWSVLKVGCCAAGKVA